MSCHLNQSIYDDLSNSRNATYNKLIAVERELQELDAHYPWLTAGREYLVDRIYWYREFLGLPQTRETTGHYRPPSASISSELTRRDAQHVSAVEAMVARMLIMGAIVQRVDAERSSR